MKKRLILQAMTLGMALTLGYNGVAHATTPVTANEINPQNKPITDTDVIHAENEWGKGIVEIGKIYQNGGDYKAVASELIDRMYAYGDGEVLFKPTKAANDQFREDKEQALSYFVGGSNPEDHGFALQPWSKVRFENSHIDVNSSTAIAMGNYFFTDAKTNKEVKVEFTMGFERAKDGHLEIFLHHSSIPYQPAH
ncbi:MAG: hypothetical protein ACYC3N_11300 [Halothiobacillus sp.]